MARCTRPESLLTFLSRPWKMVIRVDQMPMKRHDDSQHSGRLAVTFGEFRVVDRVVASIASLPRLGFDGSMMTRHDNSQRSSRLAVTQPMYRPLTSRTEKQLTARADRPLRDPAHAVAFTTAVAVGGTGSVHRRTGMRAGPTLPGGEGSRPGSLPATDCPQNPPPALPAIQTHCCSDHRHAWRCNADPDVDLEKKEVRMILKEPHARAA